MSSELENLNQKINELDEAREYCSGIIKNVKNKKTNPIFCRNISYIGDIMNEINSGLHGNEGRPMILTNHLNQLLNVYSVEKDDLQQKNIELRDKGMEHFISDTRKPIKENFAGLDDTFKDIINIFKKILDYLEKTYKFITDKLTKFIEISIQVLEVLVKFIIDIVPKLVEQTITFMKKLYQKFILVGFFSILLYPVIHLILFKYWSYVLDTDLPTNSLVLYPALLISMYLFWNQTAMLDNWKNNTINFIVNNIEGAFKSIAINFFGFPKDHKFFTSKTDNSVEKTELFFDMLYKNIISIMIHTMVVLLILKMIFFNYLGFIMQSIPSIKEFYLYIVIQIRELYYNL